MTLALSTIQNVAVLRGNEYLNKQVALKAQLIASGALVKEDVKDGRRVINVTSGGLDSVGVIDGGAAFPGSSLSAAVSASSLSQGSQPYQLTALPANFVGVVRIPYDAAEVINGKGAQVSLIKENFDLVGKNLGMQLGRAVFSPVFCYVTQAQLTAATLTNPSASGLAASATWAASQVMSVTLDDVRGFREGQVVDVFSDTTSGSGVPLALSARLGQALVGAITFTSASSCAGTISLTALSAIVNSAGLGLVFTIPGLLSATNASEKFTSLSSASGSAALYGSSDTIPSWSGNQSGDFSTALTSGRMREMMDSIGARSGEDVRFIAMSRMGFTDYELSVMNGAFNSSGVQTAAGGGVRMYSEGDSLDPFGKNAARPTFAGKQIVVDDNCPSREVYMVGENAAKLGVWREIKPLTGQTAEMSQLFFEYQIKCGGMYNQLILKRNAIARLRSSIS
jgi:hypothetical protein